MIEHDNIIGFIDYDEESNSLMLEKADASLNVQHLLNDLTLSARAGMIVGLGLGLEYMHSHEITHNNFNLKNLLSINETAKISDMGSCRDYRETDSIAGEPPEWAIEMIAAGEMSLAAVSQTFTKETDVRQDRKDFVKAAYNLLIQEGNDLAIPEDYSAKMTATLADNEALSAEELADSKRVFGKAVGGDVNTSLEDVQKLSAIFAKLV